MSTTYHATRSGVPGRESWWVAMKWTRSRHRYGGSALLHQADSEQQATDIAAELSRRMNPASRPAR